MGNTGSMVVRENNESTYLFAGADDTPIEQDRLAVLAQYEDADTIRRLEALGVAEGWSCLDVGAGSGSIAHWLCNRVGPEGRVVAVDLETDALERAAAPNLEVLRHDILAGPVSQGTFDLVHTRNVLVHLARRDEALQHMIEAAKPGGLIVVGEPDVHDVTPAREHALAERMIAAVLDLLRKAGVDVGYGGRLPLHLEAHGLTGVEAESTRSYARGGSLAGEFVALTIERLRERLIASGTVDETDFERFQALLTDADFAFWTMTKVTASGRRPLAR